MNYILSLSGVALSGAILGTVLTANGASTRGFTQFWAIGITAALVASLITGVGARRRRVTGEG